MNDSIETILVKPLTWGEAASYRDAWNEMVTEHASAAVAGALAVPSFFQTFEWAFAWWSAFGAGSELLLLGAFEGAVLVGVAALMVTRERLPLPCKVVRFIGSPNCASDYNSFVYAPGRLDVLDALGAWLEANPERWDQLDFTHLPGMSPEIGYLTGTLGAKVAGSELTYYLDAPTRVLGIADEDREVVNKKSLKRHFNGFKSQGELTYSHRESAAEIHAELDGFFAQHIGRRSDKGTISQFTNERERDFFRNLVDVLMPLGWLRFFTISLDGVAVAHHFGFEFGRKFYWYKPAFDVKHTKGSPGEVLLKTLLEYSIDRKLKEFDFTAGNEAFKYRFSNQVRKLYRVRVFRSFPQFLFFKADLWARLFKRWLLKVFARKS